MSKHPNIVYFHSHDTGREISPFGAAVATPAFQRFAEQGLTLRDCHCAGPTCSPSRAALLTGMWAHQAGMIGLAHRGFGLADNRWHLAQHLREHGYRTALAGIQHESDDPAKLGYDEQLNPQRGDLHTTAAAVAYLNEHQHDDAPFMLTVGYIATHRGGRSQEDFAGEGEESNPGWLRAPVPLPDDPAVREDIARLQRSIHFLDRQLAGVLGAIHHYGLADNTIVLVTTDHGIAFPGMKCNLTHHGTGVLCMLRGPGVPQGAVSNSLVSHVDIFPTLCELAGVPTPERCVGHSLKPIMADTATEIRDELFSEVTYHAAYEPMRMIRTKRWCYIRRFGDRRERVRPNCDESPSKDILLADGWGGDQLADEELYDNLRDPGEAHNCIHEAKHDATLAALRAKLDAWMRDTNDPLLEGDVPPPAGVLVNAVDGDSPQEQPLQY